jgi:hypothetical protein
MNFKPIIDFTKKHKKEVAAGGAFVISGVLYGAKKINDKIKKRKLSHAEAVEEYKKELKEVEYALAHEHLSELEKSKLQKLKKYYKKEIEKHNRKMG